MSDRIFKTGIVITLALLVCSFIIIGLGTFFYLTQTRTTTSVASNPSPAPALASAPRVGALAPDFTLPDVDGKPYQLASLRGNVVVLNFWATWCAPCRAELPALEKVRAQYAERKIIIWGINQQEFIESVRGYAELYHLNFPLLLDSRAEVARAYHVNALPTTFFIDRGGIIRHIEIGGPMSESFLQLQIGKMVEETQ